MRGGVRFDTGAGFSHAIPTYIISNTFYFISYSKQKQLASALLGGAKILGVTVTVSSSGHLSEDKETGTNVMRVWRSGHQKASEQQP
jgi:hypothetical protein